MTRNSQELVSNRRVAVVTGASRGIGRGIATALGERGWIVYVTGRSTGDGELTIDATARLVDERGGIGRSGGDRPRGRHADRRAVRAGGSRAGPPRPARQQRLHDPRSARLVGWLLGTPALHLGRPGRHRTPSPLRGELACRPASVRRSAGRADRQRLLARRTALPLQLAPTARARPASTGSPRTWRSSSVAQAWLP